METRSSRRNREAARENTEPEPAIEPATDDVPVEVWHPIWVAIKEGEGVFKHWSLFVEDEKDEDKSFIVHVQGSAGRFRYEQKYRNVRESGSLIEMIQVGHVEEANLRGVRRIARGVEVKNDDMTWNCQDFVWNVLGAIAEAELTDAEDDVYINGRQTVWSRMEGLA